jgi:hypothetical protein
MVEKSLTKGYIYHIIRSNFEKEKHRDLESRRKYANN